ncbi:YqaA family protein [Saccharophagus degradans]|uniref:Membrane protein n=2 Tax=Saccharophagus degradans TaxID=86304 RepID=Q21GI2_SACD2|nr:YqaA family protein [Saccharophagus degradans]ABD82197.1 membrane protein [Saccharophagus degradans 2-40]MBU2984608.1 DedA family protein [Saccharophagus degradans]MDO6422311.1 YqaA family protein [Saccharophagus degradans]MDO6608149.1 YqaA family protein [Saccharophagus degradans]
MLSYWLLFGSAFIAATIFPFYSEILLVTLLADGKNVALLWLFATAGNSLGAVVNWLLGKYLLRFQTKRWFPFKLDQLARYQAWFQKYGVWSLLLAWMPLGGDALTFIAGMMRVNFWVFFLLTAIGKGLRYAVVILLTLGVIHF